MNTPRLQEMERLLRSIAADPARNIGFSLECWYTDSPTHLSDIAECGTVACAIGFACMHKPFIEQGLCFTAAQTPSFKAVGGRLYGGFSAATAFFGISMDTALHLFSAEHYTGPDTPTPLHVANRIAELLEGQGLITRDDLARMYQAWCIQAGRPDLGSADEHLFDQTLTAGERAFLRRFSTTWDSLL